jgi:hypothetical protein
MPHNGGVPRRRHPHRPLSVSHTHWRSDGQAKTRYDSPGAAHGAAEERRREAGVELNVYACDFCGGWHLGSAEVRGER